MLALSAGTWHIADLWFQPLSAATLIAAGRGGLLLLLALGLMGSGRLALFLVFVFCATALVDTNATLLTQQPVLLLEIALMVLALALLAAPQPAVRD